MEGYQYLTGQQGLNPPTDLVSPLSPFSTLPSPDPTLLPAWDQVAWRAYIQAALCFSFDGEKAAAAAHIKASLVRLGRQRRDFAGNLKADPHNGRIQLEKHSNDEITFEVVDHGDKFPYTYAQLKAKDFAPSAFVHPDFALDGALAPFRLVPVCQVRASFIQGGLILWVYLHHTFADGDALHMFLDCFSAQTRGTEVDYPQNINFEPASSSSSSCSTVEELLKDCPEYAIKAPSGPADAHSPAALGTPLAHMTTNRPSTCQMAQKCNMFIFRHDRLDLLRSLIEAIQPAGQKKRPSSYVALAALTWAHATRARTSTEEEEEAPGAAARADPSRPARLTKCVNWKARAFREEMDREGGYFGVAVAQPFSQLPAGEVVAPCYDFNAAVPLVRAIEETIASVDDDFVARRTAALRAAAAGDPRAVVLDIDPCDARHLAFNTWRFIGADAEWGISGTIGAAAVKADAVRPVRGQLLMGGHALIMPARRDSGVHELAVTLPERAMEALMSDHDYMRWVDRVIE
ncbi:hypothetical protein VPNG_09584 [Cytospora leucostoma]|uniref:Condensation domain-containing protein n=1 Tax=Cytospora leucostoma TaxID=1230097 RepID=A0A423VN34_9PEZI|nr:hypothetical protein VPNG_09584 [Cytospora leucostoma]